MKKIKDEGGNAGAGEISLNTTPAFTAEAVALQRRMRFNPLRMLDPENLSLALDQFDIGILRQAGLLWDAMIRRDDTLSFVVQQLENSIAGKSWGVFKKKNADPVEAARHAAALGYFYDSVTAVNAFDRNERGDRHLMLRQMGGAYGSRYAVHHFVWRPEPGKMIEVEGDEDGSPIAPVPALSAEMEFVPLWYFENTTGVLRFLPFGGFGAIGQEMDFEGEWMCTTGPGIMFAASICYVFKRMTFQDWTIFNERYSQQKVVGQTPESKDSPQGEAMAEMVSEFNGDQGIVLYNSQPGEKPPISLLGPEGTASVDLFERFLDRQDRKMTVMFRGSDLRNMSRDKNVTGVSAQSEETEALELAHCASIASACREFIDRMVIRYCFGEDVEPLAYFGLPDMDKEDAQQLRDSAGFLADRGALVEAATIAERLGVTLTEDADEALQASAPKAAGDGTDPADPTDRTDRKNAKTANAREARLEELIEEALRSVNGGNPNHDHSNGRFSGGEGDTRANIQHGRNALQRVVAEETDVIAAMHRQEIGGIDFVWDHKEHGIKHLIERREHQDSVRPDLNKLGSSELLDRVPEVIARGKINPVGSKLEIDHEGIRVILARNDGKSANPWMMSGFELNPSSPRKGGNR